MSPCPGCHPRRPAVTAVLGAAILAALALPLAHPGGASASPAAPPPDATAAPSVDWGDLDTSALEAGPAPAPQTQLTFLLGLADDGAGRAAFARSVSDPRSADYGRYLTVADAVARFGASDATLDAVTGYFAGIGVGADPDPTRTWVEVTMPIALAEVAFSTTWGSFTYPLPSIYNDNYWLYPSSTPTLPAALQGLVDRVHGAVAFDVDIAPGIPDAPSGAVPGDLTEPVAGGTPVRTGTPSGCTDGTSIAGGNLGMSPSQVLTAYGIDELHARGLRGEGRRVAIVDNSLYDPAWLATFRDCFGLSDATPVTPHVVGSPTLSPDGSGETILDLSVMSAVAPAVDRLDVFMVDPTPNPDIDDEALGLLAMFAAPLDAAATGGIAPDVVSISFSGCEASPLYWQGRRPAVDLVEEVLATAAAAGISYMVSTGDSGSSGCYANLRVEAPETTGLSTQFPASSEWVTAVGATNLTLDAGNAIVSSGVWNDTQYPAPLDSPYGGTGGASVLITRPWYQQIPEVPAGDMRTVPDVSLFGDLYPGYAINQGAWNYIGGTSAAAPLFAGMVVLLDQQAAAAGQPRIGFANPLVYEMAAAGAAILDVTLGTNDVFDTGCCAATPGYDLASGWGSPMATEVSAALAAPTVSLGSTVAAGATASAAGATASTATGPYSVTLRVSAVLAAGEVLSYQWDTDGNGTVDQSTTSPALEVNYSGSGSHEPSVRVVTSMGRVGSGTTTVVVGAPAAPATTTTAPATTTPPTPAPYATSPSGAPLAFTG